MAASKAAIAIANVVLLAVGIGIGIGIGHVVKPDSEEDKLLKKLITDGDSSIQQKLLDEILSQNIHTYLK